MPGMWHNPTSPSQNVGNCLGDRPVVRQSKYFRKYESGNETKSLLGMGNHMQWDTDQLSGVFKGQNTFDADADAYFHPKFQPQQQFRPKIQDHEVSDEFDFNDSLDKLKKLQDQLEFLDYQEKRSSPLRPTHAQYKPPQQQFQCHHRQQQQQQQQQQPNFSPVQYNLSPPPPRLTRWQTSASCYGSGVSPQRGQISMG